MLFHITGRAEAERGREMGEYRATSLGTEGFIHCSTAEQVGPVADALYSDARDLVLLCIDPVELRAPLRWEAPPGGDETFPHVYGPIPAGAIVDVVSLEPDRHGRFDLPLPAATIARRPPRSLDELAARLREALAPYTGPWWVAGGWALDLFLGQVTRPHEDLDVTIPRREVALLAREMVGWELCIPTPDALIEWLPGPYPADQHQIWARPARRNRSASGVIAFSAHPLATDLLIEDIENDHWRFRRVQQVDAPLSRYGRIDSRGVPYVGPEVQLLYKAKPHPTGKRRNDDDFARVVPHLDGDARGWLRRALERTNPSHHWLAQL